MYKREGEQLPITIPIDWYKELEAELHSMNINCQGWIAKSNEQKVQVEELTAKLDKAREALNVIVDWTTDSYACHIAETVLKELDK